MITCILMAAWKPTRWFCRELNQEVEIPRGSFPAGQATIAREANDSRDVVRKAIQRMTGGGFLKIKAITELLEGGTEGGSVFPKNARRVRSRVKLYVIENYSKWQSETQSTHNIPTEAPQKSPLTEEALRIHKNLEEGSSSENEEGEANGNQLRTNDRKKKSPPTLDMFGDDPLRDLARDWLEAVHGKEAALDLERLANWRDDLHKLIRIDKRRWEDVETMVRFLIQDKVERRSRRDWGGWFHACRSPAKLKKKRKECGTLYFDFIWEKEELGTWTGEPSSGRITSDPKVWAKQENIPLSGAENES